jgi:hypothetical protein
MSLFLAILFLVFPIFIIQDISLDGLNVKQFTAAYCGLFNEAGVPPKRKLASFIVSPDAAVQPG